jgi:DNA polymerase III gamma/tau subunit
LSFELCEQLSLNKNDIFIFKDSKEKIKVKDIKEFLEKVFITPSYIAQIFIIENISRMTEESANSCLKIFEEPPI